MPTGQDRWPLASDRRPGDTARMSRFATDLGLWLLCSGGLLLVVGVGIAVEAKGGPGQDYVIGIALASLVCVPVGWVIQAFLVGEGYRLTRRPDQAADYEDRT